MASDSVPVAAVEAGVVAGTGAGTDAAGVSAGLLVSMAGTAAAGAFDAVGCNTARVSAGSGGGVVVGGAAVDETSDVDTMGKAVVSAE